MPFAVIAVTLLVLAGTYASVYAYMERSGDNIDNLNIELDVFDSSAEEFTDSVNSGLGDILSEISRGGTSGGLIGINDEFDRRSASWLEFVFPLTNGVVTAFLRGHSVSLTSESMKIESHDSTASRPVFLIAVGSISVEMVSASGRGSVELAVNADVSSTLPFLVEQGTLFKLASEGERSFISQLISYQLSSLAQYRVIQGFGSVNEYGSRGTRSMITDEDVMDAYLNAVSIAEVLYFRTSSENRIKADAERIDAAEHLISNDGFIEIDLSLVYAQTISSFMDQFIVQWLEYFMTDRIIEYIDWMLDRFADITELAKDMLRSIAGIFGKKGPEKRTAGTYLKAVMEQAGYGEREYRYAESGKKCYIMTQYFEWTLQNGEVVSVPEMSIDIDYPNVDIVEWGGWDGFLSNYRNHTNTVAESLRSILNAVCIGLSSSRGLGLVRISADPYDDKDFCDSLSGALNTALEMQRYEVERVASEAVSSHTFIDPMYGCMFEVIEQNSESIFLIKGFRKNIEAAVERKVRDHLESEYGKVLDPHVVASAVKDTMESASISELMDSYRQRAEEITRIIGSVLNSVKADMGVMGTLLSVILTRGLISVDVHSEVQGRVVPLCDEMISHLRSGSLGITELPGTDTFSVSDNIGRESLQNVELSRTDDISIPVTSPVENAHLNCHMIDFLDKERKTSSYTAVFTVKLNGSISYTSRSYSFVSNSLGVPDSVYSDTVLLDVTVNVPVISAWGLAGVQYTPSKNILDDIKDGLWELLLDLLDPLLGPLRELYRMANTAFTMLSNALVEISSYVSELIAKLFDAISGPLNLMQDAIERAFDRIVGSAEGFMKLNLSKQEFGIRFHEFELKITMNASDIILGGKTVIKLAFSAPIGNSDMEAAIEIKRSEKGEYSVAGSARFTSESWNAHVSVDPFMKVRPHMVEVTGTIRDTEFQITIPELVQYDKLEFRLSDIPGIGTMLSNIPLPIPGVKGSIDAGVQLKYDTPYKHGLVINEFESNPKGNDAENEWAELYNSTSQTIDLDGYRLVPGSGEGKTHTIKGTSIAPGEHLVIVFPKLTLNNTTGIKGNGDRIILLDTEGNEVDKTPWKTDGKNDGNSWQRETDGSTKWVFKKDTKGKQNGGKLMGGNQIKVMLQQCVIEAGKEAFSEMGDITDTEGISKALERTVELTIEKAIETIAGCVVEASVFLEIEFADLTGSAHLGIRLAIVIGSDLIEDGLKWIIGEIKGMMQNIDNPSGLDPKTVISDDIHIQTTAYTGISAPRILRAGTDKEIRAAVVIQCNISAVCTLLGKDTGTWNVTAGMKIEDVPSALVPKALKANKEKHADLWLIKADFSKAS